MTGRSYGALIFVLIFFYYQFAPLELYFELVCLNFSKQKAFLTSERLLLIIYISQYHKHTFLQLLIVVVVEIVVVVNIEIIVL
ncbi:MAG TPA: hypothetical protein DCP54_08715 [Chryseobacterium sp.]|nr:hypothetical protein [Chryseobacterium sp.]